MRIAARIRRSGPRGRNSCSLLAALLAALGAGALAPSEAAARDCAWYGVNTTSVYGGLNRLDENYASKVESTGAGAIRLPFRIDGKQAWDGALHAQYDALLEIAARHRLPVLGILLYESSPLGQEQWNDDPDGDGWTDYNQSFLGIGLELLGRYGDRIKAWEIWNEPNCWNDAGYRDDPRHAGCYYMLPRVYAKLFTELWVQSRTLAARHGLSFVSGGLFAHDIGGSFSTAADYMEEVYALGPWDWLEANHGRRYPWDAFGYHVYIDQDVAATPDRLAQYLDAIEALKAAHNDPSPLWITEFGWTTQRVSEQRQAENVGVALSFFEGRPEIHRAFVFKADDYDGWGLFHGDWSEKPVAAVLRQHAAGCTGRPPPPTPDAGMPPDAATPEPPDAAMPPDAGQPDLEDAATPPDADQALPDAAATADAAQVGADAGSGLDAAASGDAGTGEQDAGIEADAGELPAGPGPMDGEAIGSCGCSAAGAGTGAAFLIFLFAALSPRRKPGGRP